MVVGASILDIDGSLKISFPAEMPPGDVRGFDVRSGQLRWRFESIPQGRNAVETWENGSWKHTGDANVWSLMSCDEKLGYVYLPFGSPTNDYYGGHRPGGISSPKVWSPLTPELAIACGIFRQCITACGIMIFRLRRTW